MEVKQLMTKKVRSVDYDTHVLDIIKLFQKHHLRGCPVLKKGKMIGLITERDILDFMEIHNYGRTLLLPTPFDFIERVLDNQEEMKELKSEFEKLKHSKAEDVMSDNPKTISPEEHVTRAAVIMTDENVAVLPVIEKNELVGILTRSDLMKAL